MKPRRIWRSGTAAHWNVADTAEVWMRNQTEKAIAFRALRASPRRGGVRALSRAALGAFLRAAREMREHGTFAFAAEAVSYRDVSAMFGA